MNSDNEQSAATAARSEELSPALAEGHNNIIQRLQQEVEAAQHSEQLKTIVQTFIIDFSEHIKSLTTRAEKAEREKEDMVKNQETLMARIEDLEKENRDPEQRSTLNKVTQCEEDMGHMKTRMLKLQTSFTKLSQEMTLTSKLQEAAVEMQERVQKERSVLVTIDDLEDENKQLAERYQTLITKLEEAVEEMDRKMEKERSLLLLIADIEDENKQLEERCQTLLPKLEEAVEEMDRKMVKESLTVRAEGLEKDNRDLTERYQTLLTKAQKAAEEMREKTKKERCLVVKIEGLEKENRDLEWRYRTLLTKAQKAAVERENMEKNGRSVAGRMGELEEEMADLKLIITQKKRGFWEKVFKRESEAQRAMRTRLKAKKKELMELEQQRTEV